MDVMVVLVRGLILGLEQERTIVLFSTLNTCPGGIKESYAYSHMLGPFVHKESEWWTVPHEGQWLVLAGIKGSIPVQNILA